MASLDKQSVRAEVDKLKSEFDALCAAGKVSGEVRVVMRSMLMVVDLILSVFLERTTRKNSRNSSLSQTEKDESALEAHGTHNKGKPEQRATAANTRVVETVTVSEVAFCERCGEDLHSIPAHAHERRTRVDILFEKVVDHVDAQVKSCPCCRHETKAPFPDGRSGPLQYGDGLRAFAINLLVCQMVAINRVQKLLKSMVGEVLSEATLLKFVLRLHQAFHIGQGSEWRLKHSQHIIDVCGPTRSSSKQ